MIAPVKGRARLAVAIMACAVGSASLAYQVVWVRTLALIFGGTTLTVCAALAAFFGGLAIGSWMGGRLADRRPQSTLLFFSAVEIATGLYGFASLSIFRGVEAMYLAVYPSLAEHASLFAGVQFLFIALAILPAAVLMGGTLPLLSRCVVSEPSGIVGSVGAVFGWILLGAASGNAATTYGLLPTVGLNVTVALAAGVNVLAGAAGLLLHWRLRKQRVLPYAEVSRPSSAADDSSDHGIKSLILVGLVVSGFAATTFEFGWARLLTMVMGSSVYTHGILVVVVLSGLGMGSALYGLAKRTTEGYQRSFATLEFLVAFAAAVSMIVLPRIPFLFVRFFPLFRDEFGRQIGAQFVASILVALVPSLLFGAMFPAVIGSFGGATVRVGRTIGSAAMANTVGAIVGVCLAGLILIPRIGLRVTMILGVLVTVGAGSAVWWYVRAPRRLRLKSLAPGVAALLIVGILPAWPREVFATGISFFLSRYVNNEPFADIVSRMHLLYNHDGMNSTISVDEAGQTLFYRSDGRIEASTDSVDMANQSFLGHLPMLLHPAPRDVVVLGLGIGITAAAVARYPVQRIDIVEPEPAAEQAARYFDSFTRKVLDDPRVHLIIGDSRNRLLGMPKRYDVVISNPTDLWVSGAGSLVTLEYYRAVGERLKPGGIFAQRIDTHTLLPDDVALLAATFHAVFPRMQVWAPSPDTLIFLGTRDPVAWDYRRLQEHFTRTPGVADDLTGAGIWLPYALFGARVLGENESDTFTREIDDFNTDDHPALEFRSPRSLYVETTPITMMDLNHFRRADLPVIAGFDPQRDLDADGTYLLGFAYASAGWSELAIKYMKRSTMMAPNRASFFVGLGNEDRVAGRALDARGAYEQALTLDINNVEALISLGEIRLDEGQLDWTRVLADRALRLAPQNARVHALIGRLLEAEH